MFLCEDMAPAADLHYSDQELKLEAAKCPLRKLLVTSQTMHQKFDLPVK